MSVDLLSDQRVIIGLPGQAERHLSYKDLKNFLGFRFALNEIYTEKLLSVILESLI